MDATLKEGRIPEEVRRTLDVVMPGLSENLDRTLKGVESALGGGNPRDVAGAMGFAVPPASKLDYFVASPTRAKELEDARDREWREKLLALELQHKEYCERAEQELNISLSNELNAKKRARHAEIKYDWLRKKYLREQRQVAKKQCQVDRYQQLLTMYRTVLADVCAEWDVQQEKVAAVEKEGTYPYGDEEGLDYEEDEFEKKLNEVSEEKEDERAASPKDSED